MGQHLSRLVTSLVVGVVALGVVPPPIIGGAALRAAAQEDLPGTLRQALESGAYRDAERQAVEWCARVEGQFGSDSLEVARARDLLVEALLKNGKAAASTTLALAERVVHFKEQRPQNDQRELAASLLNLAAVRIHRGEFRTALPLAERALALRIEALPPDDPGVAEALDSVTLALIDLERFQQAQPKLEQSLRIREKQATLSPLALARTLELAGQLHRSAGRYSEAVAPVDRALDLWDRFAPNHSDRASTFNLRGYVSFLIGDILTAQHMWVDAVALSEQALGPGHPATGVYLRGLALSARALGNLVEARRLRERALRIGEVSLAPCDPEFAWMLNDVAISLWFQGDYASAQKHFGRELTTIENCLGPKHVNIATVVFNQASLAREMGEFTEAEKLMMRAIRVWSDALGPTHPFVANGVGDLADLLASRGQYARARSLFQQALSIRRRALGAEHPDVASTLTDLARMNAELGNFTLALQLSDQATTILERTPGRDPDHLARILDLRGTVEARQGNYSAAQANVTRALAARERLYGTSHTISAQTRAHLASTQFALGLSDDAMSAALDAERSGREQLRFTARYLPERQALAYANARPRGLDVALSIVAANPAANTSSAFDSVVQSRAVVLDELTARAQSAGTADPQLATLSASMAAGRERFARLMLLSIQHDSSASIEVVDEARQQKEEAERALAERSVALRAELAQARINLADVRRAMPPSSALVSFVRYDRTSFTTTRSRTVARTEASFIAFITRSDEPAVAAVPLGPAVSIETSINLWREQAGPHGIAASGPTGQSERAYQAAGTRLRQRVWDSLSEHLRDVSQVFIVPDGALNLVSFAALPTVDKRFLLEDGPVIHYLSTERDLVPAEVTVSGRGLLAVGGPAFNDQGQSSLQSSSRGSGCGAYASLRFDDLPGSAQEALDIASVWSSEMPEGTKRDDIVVLSGREATKAAVSQSVAGRQVVHLATHGFFLRSRCETSVGSTRSVGGLAAASAGDSQLDENPLSLAGLAFAGANRRPGAAVAQDDGILTAEEVAGLNLQGTQWAVLSACDTGLGDIRAGEGVFGLRRAFQIAGARTIIMSLWSIDDQATRRWMQALYEERFQKNSSTAAAVQNASVRVLQERRARGQSTHPFYWAGFVAAGDWR